MATRNGSNKAQKLEGFVKKQLSEAQKRFHHLEESAERVVEEIRVRGHQGRKELEVMLQTFKPAELLDRPVVKQLEQQAERASDVVRKGWDRLQTRVVKAAGVATQAQVKQLSREVSKLSKKVTELVGKGSEASHH